MSAKIEVLTDRIGKSRSVPDPLRAVRHFDAARIKLEKLAAWRQELKQELAQCTHERDSAWSEIDHLKTERNAQLAELERISVLLDAQEAVIAELCDDRARLIDNYETEVDFAPGSQEEPALTVRVLEKIDSHEPHPTEEMRSVDVTTRDGNQLLGWVRRLLPRIAQ
jgi:chromosome segregation ATPase